MTLRKWLYQTLEIPSKEEHEEDRDVFRLLRMLLLKIDGQFFSELRQSRSQGGSYQQQYSKYICHVQRYLCKKQFKRLKNSYQVELRQSKDDNQLLKLALFMGINSDLKKEIVDKIVGFSQDDQRQLMRVIKEIQKECQQVIDIKKIIERIELIETANQQLKASVQYKSDVLIHQIAELNEVQQENRSLSTEIQLYSNQKAHAFAQVGSVEMQDFSYSCRSIKDQIFKITNNYEDLNAQNLKQQNNNAKLKQDLKVYGKTIKQHIDQLDKLKKQYMLANQQFVLRQIPQCNNNQILPPLCLRNVTNKMNLSSSINNKSRKIDTERTNCESQQERSIQLEQKRCSLGLLLQISQLQKEIQQKMERVEHLKLIQEDGRDKNRKLSKRLQRIKKQHQVYTNRFTSYSSHSVGLMTK